MSEFYTVEKDGAVIVTTATGWAAVCQPVADLLLRVGRNIAEPTPPEPPTYEVVGAGGATEEKTYDAEGAADPHTPPEDQEKWAAYVEERAAYDEQMADIERQRNEMRGRFLALRGIKVRGLPDDLEAWAAEQELLFGMSIDTTLPRPTALLLAFIDQNVVRTADDGAKIVAGILRASGMDQEALDSVEATFRHSMGQAGRADVAGDTAVSEAGSGQEGTTGVAARPARRRARRDAPKPNGGDVGEHTD